MNKLYEVRLIDCQRIYVVANDIVGVQRALISKSANPSDIDSIRLLNGPLITEIGQPDQWINDDFRPMWDLLSSSARLEQKLNGVGQKLDLLIQLEKERMSETNELFQKVLARIDSATNVLGVATQRVATEIADLKEQVKAAIKNAGMSPDQESALLNQFDDKATRLEAIGEQLTTIGKETPPTGGTGGTGEGQTGDTVVATA